MSKNTLQMGSSSTSESPQKETLAARHYRKALSLMERAETQGFQDTGLLAEAHSLLYICLRESPHNPDYLMLMAYLMFLIEHRQLAQRYLNQLLELEPEHAAGLQLQQELDLDGAHSPQQLWLYDVQGYADIALPESSADFDFLYDETEAFLEQQRLYFMQQQVPFEPSLEEEINEAQHFLYQQILHVQTLLDERMPILSEEFEIAELEQTRRPLNQLQQRYEKAVWFGGIFEVLQDGCIAIRQDATQLLKALKTKTTAKKLDQELLDLLNLCDRLADDLDAISEVVPVEPLLPAYEEALRYVQHVQEVFDENYL